MSTPSRPTVCIPNQQHRQKKPFVAPKKVPTRIYPQPVSQHQKWKEKTGSPPINLNSLRESLLVVLFPNTGKTTPQSVRQVTLEFNWSPLWEVTIDALESASSVEATVSPSSDQMTGSEFKPKKQLQKKNHPAKTSSNHLFIVFGSEIIMKFSKYPNPNIWSTTPRSPSHHLQRYVHVHDGWHHESLQETPRNPMATNLWLHSDLHVTMFFFLAGGKMTPCRKMLQIYNLALAPKTLINTVFQQWV